MEQLVGREAELQAVRDALDATRAGRRSCWRARRASARPRSGGPGSPRPSRAACGARRAAGGGGDGALSRGARRPARPARGRASATTFPAPQRQALDVALLQDGPERRTRSSPRAVGAATLGVLRAAAAWHARCCWPSTTSSGSTPASASALRFALRRLERRPRRCSSRRGASARGADALDIGLAEERLTRIAVGPLGPDALQRCFSAARSTDPAARARAARRAVRRQPLLRAGAGASGAAAGRRAGA